MIRNKIMKISDGFYRYACSCGDPKCDIGLYFDYAGPGYITLNMYKTLTVSDFCIDENWFSMVYTRIKLSLKLLFTGELTVEGDLVVTSEEDVKSLIDGLYEGIEHIRKSNNDKEHLV